VRQGAYYLNFAGKASTVIGATACAAALNVLLLFVLGRRYGATGAALAYAISLGGLSVAFFLLGLSIRRLRAGPGRPRL